MSVTSVGERRGLKPGQRHSGQFRKGYDPRRHVEGPSQVKREFKVAIRESAERAVEVLQEILDDTKAPVKERREAAALVIAHAHGSPVNRVLHAEVDQRQQSVDTLSLDELVKHASAVIESQPALIQGEITTESYRQDDHIG